LLRLGDPFLFGSAPTLYLISLLSPIALVMPGQLYFPVSVAFPSSASASTSSASSPSGSPPVAHSMYQSDAYPPPDIALHAPFGTKRHSSRHSTISFPKSGIEIPLAAPLDDHPDSRITIPHPYARLHAKKDSSKHRKIWNHVLEKQLFSPQELSVLSRLPSFSCVRH